MPKKSLNETLNADVSLFLTDAEKYQKVIVDILMNLVTTRKQSGLYVALNKPSKTLKAFFKKNGIDANKLFFVETAEGKVKEQKTNVMYVVPEDLTGIGITLTKLLKGGKYDFILFDTVDTFLVYNKKQRLDRFFTTVVQRIRSADKKCILIGIKESLVEHMLHVSVERLSDEIVDLAPTPQERFEKTFLKL